LDLLNFFLPFDSKTHILSPEIMGSIQEIVEALRPRVILIETSVKVKDKALAPNGYFSAFDSQVRWQNYGIPIKCRRRFVIALRNDISFQFNFGDWLSTYESFNNIEGALTANWPYANNWQEWNFSARMTKKIPLEVLNATRPGTSAFKNTCTNTQCTEYGQEIYESKGPNCVICKQKLPRPNAKYAKHYSRYVGIFKLDRNGIVPHCLPKQFDNLRCYISPFNNNALTVAEGALLIGMGAYPYRVSTSCKTNHLRKYISHASNPRLNQIFAQIISQFLEILDSQSTILNFVSQSNNEQNISQVLYTNILTPQSAFKLWQMVFDKLVAGQIPLTEHITNFLNSYSNEETQWWYYYYLGAVNSWNQNNHEIQNDNIVVETQDYTDEMDLGN